MRKVFIVRLTDEERSQLDTLVRKGKASALTITRARILLKADQGEQGEGWTDAQVAEALNVAPKTVFNSRLTRAKFAGDGWKRAWRPR